MTQTATQPRTPAAAEFGAPAYRNPYGQPAQRGHVYAVDDSPSNVFSITGDGLKKTGARVSIVWDDGTTAQELPDHIAQPWLDAAAEQGRAPATAELIEELLSKARTKDAQRAAQVQQEKAEREDTQAAFLASVAPLIPEAAKAYIMAELIEDKSDSMSDYWGGETKRRVLLGFSSHTRKLFPELRKAAGNHPDTAHLMDADERAEHRENYSMGGGTYLKAGSRYSNGWKIKKHSFYCEGEERARRIEVSEIAVTAPATPAAPAQQVGAVTIEEHTHTKKGFQMWIVCLADRVERSEYDALLTQARAAGGWYSRKWGTTPAGFAFKSQASAENFANNIAAGAGTPTTAAPATTGPDRAEAMADKLDAIADKLHNDITDKFRTRTENTPKQRKQATQARQEGRDLERAQAGLRRLAALHREGAAPQILLNVTSKKAALDMAREKLDYSESGYYDAGRHTGKPAADTDAARAFWDLVGPKSADDIKRDKIEALQAKIANSTIDGFFPTPADIVARMIDNADLSEGQRILEPEAGSGAIALQIKEAQPTADLVCIEANGRLCELLELKGIEAEHADFMEAEDLGTFDRVLMNPPFEKGQDVEHVQRAHSLLKPQGILVAIVSPSFQFNSARKFAAFREWLDAQPHTVEQIEAGAFKASGTNIATVLLTIHTQAQEA